MTLSNLLVFALALMVAAGSPGPNVAALVARVLSNGLKDVLPFLVALWLGEMLWLTCAVAGVRFQRMLVVPLIFMVIWNFAGAMALIPVVGQEKTIQYTGTSVYLAIAAIVFACLFSSYE